MKEERRERRKESEHPSLKDRRAGVFRLFPAGGNQRGKWKSKRNPF
jgi:hypothetical protein